MLCYGITNSSQSVSPRLVYTVHACERSMHALYVYIDTKYVDMKEVYEVMFSSFDINIVAAGGIEKAKLYELHSEP